MSLNLVVNISVGKKFLKMVLNHFKSKCSIRDKTRVVEDSMILVDNMQLLVMTNKGINVIVVCVNIL